MEGPGSQPDESISSYSLIGKSAIHIKWRIKVQILVRT